MQSRNKHLMETIFEVSIQPTAGYLVNCHLSNHEVSKLYCNHMKQKFCHLLFTLANVKASFHSGKLSVDWNGQENFSLSCELWVGTNDFNTKKNVLVRSNTQIISLSGN